LFQLVALFLVKNYKVGIRNFKFFCIWAGWLQTAHGNIVELLNAGFRIRATWERAWQRRYGVCHSSFCVWLNVELVLWCRWEILIPWQGHHWLQNRSFQIWHWRKQFKHFLQSMGGPTKHTSFPSPLCTWSV
jgi:hypothetical protein